MQPEAAPAAHSLDGSSKSSTADIHHINALLAEAANEQRAERIEVITPATAELPTDDCGQWVKITCENWRAITKDPESGAFYTPIEPGRAQWRAAIITQTKTRQDPPRQHGDRITERLSPAAAKKIEDAAKYQHKLGRGFRTFATITFDAMNRELLRVWDNRPRSEDTDDIKQRPTIGALVGRFLNHLQMTHKRGIHFKGHYRRNGKVKTDSESGGEFTPIKWQPGFTIKGRGRPFQFVWVAEAPTNDAGDVNPHVHLMFNWHVKKHQFHAWARWIEKIWGRGFVNLTRIKKPASAANYMAKAARYLVKGADGAQGAIRGNRYNISREARAPRPRSLGRYFAGWLKDAIKVGAQMKDGAHRAGLWFSKYGFGASTKKAWGRFWQALKRDGWEFQHAPPDLHMTEFHNAGIRKAARIDRYQSLLNHSAAMDGYLDALRLDTFFEQHEPVVCH